MYGYSIFFGHREEYICSGKDAQNDAKLIAQRERKLKGSAYAVRIEPYRPHYSAYEEPGYVVICEPTPETITRIEEEYKREVFVEDLSFSRQWHRPKRKKGPRKCPLPQDDRDELGLIQDQVASERPRRYRGWYQRYRPTRDRYWKPINNNWKRRRKTRHKPVVI